MLKNDRMKRRKDGGKGQVSREGRKGYGWAPAGESEQGGVIGRAHPFC